MTSKTIIEKADDLDVFFSDLRGWRSPRPGCSPTTSSNLIQVGKVTEPVLKLLAVYSPEFPCLIEGAAKYAPRLAKTFEGNQVKQYIEFGTAQYEPYHADDRPVYGEVGHGPWCDGLPNPKVPADPAAFNEGSDIDENPPTGDLPTDHRQAPGRAGALARATPPPAATPAPTPRRRSSTRCWPARPAGPPTPTARSARCSTARSSGAVTARDHRDPGASPTADPKAAEARRPAKLRNRRNAVTIAAGVKLLIFTIVSVLVTGLLAAIMGNFGFGDSTEYKAVFSNASMLEKGDDVRVAGVSVGEVKKVEHYKRNDGAGDVQGASPTCRSPPPRAPRSASSTWSATATSPSRPATRTATRCPTASTTASAAATAPTPRAPGPG